jgi:hypothetical protein
MSVLIIINAVCMLFVYKYGKSAQTTDNSFLSTELFPLGPPARGILKISRSGPRIK